ncbi:MAG TPA: YdaU family protein, partial [Acidovorax defluvii]|nr:YdaU family protein [Acidovorax defluvii]
MTDKTDAWMPLWIGAYLADTQHLSRDEHGGYFLLLMAYWRAGAPLIDDDKRLAAIVKANPKEWKTLRATLAEFFLVSDGVWFHKRVEAELAESKERKAKAGNKAKAAAEARWGKAASIQPSNAPGNAPSIPQALLKECPTPSPITPSSLRSEGVKRMADEVPTKILDDYLAVRKAKRAGPLTETAIAGLRREAAKAGITIAEAMTACCELGWQGFNADWYAERKQKTARNGSGNVAGNFKLAAAARTIFGP